MIEQRSVRTLIQHSVSQHCQTLLALLEKREPNELKMSSVMGQVERAGP